jgi:hypothetical protein
MDKQQLLGELRERIQDGLVSKYEVEQLFAVTKEPSVSDRDASQRHVSLQQIIYYIGGGVVFIGLSVLISQNWDVFNTAVRILITLGSAVTAYVMAFLFSKREDTDGVAQPFFLISALLMPVGIGVSLYESQWSMSGNLAMIIISGLSLLIYSVSLKHFKSNLQLLFTIIFGTWLFYAVTAWLVEYDSSLYFRDSDFFFYRAFVVGVSYLLLGYYMQGGRYRLMSGPLFFFGSIALLGSALILGGWRPDQKVIWELIYPLLSLGLVFWSTQVKSRSVLLWGAVFFMAYLVKISSEYFSDSLGWPAALIISGLGMIAVGYFAFRIKKQYLG